jgi:hypothetical protein
MTYIVHAMTRAGSVSYHYELANEAAEKALKVSEQGLTDVYVVDTEGRQYALAELAQLSRDAPV